MGDIASNEMYGMNSAAKDFDGINKYIRITDISETSHKFVPNPLTSPEGELDNKYKLQKGDLVFARTGASTGKSYIYDENDGNLYFAGFLIKFHIDNAIPKFIFYNTLKEEYLNWVSVMSVRSGQPGINSNEYKKLPIYLPSFDEQNKVSNFLENVDKKIELLEKKYNSYVDFKQYLMQQIFTQKLRFDFTYEWDNYLLADISTIGKGFTPSTSNPDYWEGNLKWLSIADMNQGKYINQTTKKITFEGSKNKEPIKKGTLLMSFKLSIGKLGILNEDMYTNEAICNFQWKNKKIMTEYMYYYLSSINILKYGSQAAKGITLNNETLSTIPVLLPSIEEQNKIIDILSNLDLKINMLENIIKITSKFKKGLLQQMFV